MYARLQGIVSDEKLAHTWLPSCIENRLHSDLLTMRMDHIIGIGQFMN